MDERLSLLIQLQGIDSEIRALNIRKKQLPEMLAALEDRRTINNNNLDEVKETLLVLQKNRRDREQDLETGIQKTERLKARATDIKTNKEYQALLKEIEAAEHEKRAIEDEILSLMEKTDAAAASITAAELKVHEEDQRIQIEQQELEKALIKADNDLETADRKKQAIAARIEPAVFSEYQWLLENKSGSAIVEVRGESCSGCFMSIPPQVFVNVKKNENIITCPQCGRILFYRG